jgi:Ca2+-binding RTX toxin-like protein
MSILRFALASAVVALVLAPAADASTLTPTGPNELTFTGGPQHDGFLFYAEHGEYRAGSSDPSINVDPICEPRGEERGSTVFSCPLSTTHVIAVLGDAKSVYDPSRQDTQFDNFFGATDIPASVSLDVRGGSGVESIGVRSAGPVTVDAAGDTDFITTSDGSDTVIGGDGKDEISTGGGDDTLYAGKRGANGKGVPESPVFPDLISCGFGTDTVYMGPEDTLLEDAGCETIHIVKPKAGTEVIGYVPIKAVAQRGKKVRATLHCSLQQSCEGTVKLRTTTGKSRSLGSANFKVFPGQDDHFDVALNAAGKKLLKSTSKLKVRVIAALSFKSLASERNVTLR